MESTFGNGFELLGFFIIWLISLPIGLIVWSVFRKKILNFISSWTLWFSFFSIFVYLKSVDIFDKKQALIYFSISLFINIVFLIFIFRKSQNYKKTTLAILINLAILTLAIWFFNTY